VAARITVLIADDHPIVRRGLRSVIEVDPALQIVEEASDGDEALRLIAQSRPDVIVVDLDMPGRDGFGVVREMRRQGLPGVVVVLTMHGEPDLLNEALGLDVLGYVVKDSTVTDIVAAIIAVHGGRHFISPTLATSSKDIADECGIHYRTVENHRTNICAKLDLQGSHALLKFAMLNRASL